MYLFNFYYSITVLFSCFQTFKMTAEEKRARIADFSLGQASRFSAAGEYGRSFPHYLGTTSKIASIQFKEIKGENSLSSK